MCTKKEKQSERQRSCQDISPLHPLRSKRANQTHCYSPPHYQLFVVHALECAYSRKCVCICALMCVCVHTCACPHARARAYTCNDISFGTGCKSRRLLDGSG